MTNVEQAVVVGSFEDRKAVVKVLEALTKAGFQEDQLGFVARTHEEHVAQAQQYAPRALARGLLGGLIGAADLLLVPFIGPSDASNVLAAALPATEEALDRLPYPGSKGHKKPLQRPDDALRETHEAPLTTSEVSETTAQRQPIETTGEDEDEEQAAHEQRTSSITGGVIGGALGAAAAALLLPGIGPVVAGGIIAAALGSGAVAGNFLGTLTNIGVPHEHARHYAREVKAGRTIVTVKESARPQEAANILRQYGALDVQIH
ncbi:hypothetical protein [Dictyobacter arantiisoli]|uniref:General stress protein 17M-like domain-containing protein n=1 Tax=Dictyobacter arantiisoli TaxID=2014874 RepID=A0A5A5TF49_9CHLR|nr:hypothetical protein [Dictyobacter arantiisoli]GCF09858.1 hypothetical protein KDI_34220 [Dictyobacter arantiisoli]